MIVVLVYTPVKGNTPLPRKLYGYTILMLMSITLIGCNWLNVLIPLGQPPMMTPTLPTASPTCDAQPSVSLTSSATTISVGETLTITAQAIDVEMPLYTLTLSSGAIVRQSGNATPQNDALFEIVSSDGSQFVLRGKAVGEADATVTASGEMGCHNTGYYWGAASSTPLHLTVVAQ